MCRIYKPMHTLAGPLHYDFILLPYGYSYNREYLEANDGDILQFVEGESRKIKFVKKISLDAVADILCRIRYGKPLVNVLSLWRNDALVLGHGIQAVSDDECLLVVYETE